MINEWTFLTLTILSSLPISVPAWPSSRRIQTPPPPSPTSSTTVASADTEKKSKCLPQIHYRANNKLRCEASNVERMANKYKQCIVEEGRYRENDQDKDLTMNRVGNLILHDTGLLEDLRSV
jgi:hypothetical protein